MRVVGTSRLFLLILTALGAMVLVGCHAERVGPRTVMGTPDGLSVHGPASVIRWDDKSSEASSPGLSVGGVTVDDTGLRSVSAKSGDDRIAGFIIPMLNGKELVVDRLGNAVATKVFITDPSQTRFDKLSTAMRPDGTVEFLIEGFGASNAENIAAKDTQVVAYLEATGVITAAQAEVAIREIGAGVEVFAALANAGVDTARLFLPVPPLAGPGVGGGE